MRHFARHPILWSRYIWKRELRHRDVRFDENPRFRDWEVGYSVGREPLARVTGVKLGTLDAYFTELEPLHASLR
ncbi:MAG: hypothetical protein L3K03_09560, partial [Thermoplasmata archaeon]|nr:hypothetical protein [Thermoplasmata archaeon]